jgi:hypothetical protein
MMIYEFCITRLERQFLTRISCSCISSKCQHAFFYSYCKYDDVCDPPRKKNAYDTVAVLCAVLCYAEVGMFYFNF